MTFIELSFDGGQIWRTNGPVFSTPTSFGDARGVASDKYGGIWYSYTNRLSSHVTPHLLLSIDGGMTFTQVYTVPLPSFPVFFDYPQICFGGDGQGNYGIWMTVDAFNEETGDFINDVSFIPITGLGTIGTAQNAVINQLTNSETDPVITASADGRLWFLGYNVAFAYGLATDVAPVSVAFSLAGPIDQNYAGPWNVDIATVTTTAISSETYLVASIQSVVFDDKRQALYSMVATQSPDDSQNMYIYFRISRDNGQT